MRVPLGRESRIRRTGGSNGCAMICSIRVSEKSKQPEGPEHKALLSSSIQAKDVETSTSVTIHHPALHPKKKRRYCVAFIAEARLPKRAIFKKRAEVDGGPTNRIQKNRRQFRLVAIACHERHMLLENPRCRNRPSRKRPGHSRRERPRLHTTAA